MNDFAYHCSHSRIVLITKVFLFHPYFSIKIKNLSKITFFQIAAAYINKINTLFQPQESPSHLSIEQNHMHSPEHTIYDFPDLHQSSQPDLQPNFSPDFLSNFPPNFSPNIQPNFPTNFPPNFPPNFPLNFPPNLPPSFPPNFQPNVPSNLPINFQSDLQPNLHPSYNIPEQYFYQNLLINDTSNEKPAKWWSFHNIKEKIKSFFKHHKEKKHKQNLINSQQQWTGKI